MIVHVQMLTHVRAMIRMVSEILTALTGVHVFVYLLDARTWKQEEKKKIIC